MSQFQAPPAAILFDLDGTLIDTAPDLAAAVDHALISQGRPAVGLDAVRDMVGDGAAVMVARGLEATGGQTEALFEAALKAFYDHYAVHFADRSRPFPGLLECLKRLRAAGHKLAVCTNKHERFALPLLEALDMTRYFDAITGGDSFAFRKPDPRHLAGTLERLGPGIGWAAMIGDSRNDIEAARAARMPSVAVTFGYTTIPVRELGAGRVIEHFDELEAALDELRRETPA